MANDKENSSFDQGDIDELLGGSGGASEEEGADEAEEKDDSKSDDLTVDQDEISALLSGINGGEAKNNSGQTGTLPKSEIDDLLSDIGIGEKSRGPKKEAIEEKDIEKIRIIEELEVRKTKDLPNLDVILAIKVPVIVNLAEKKMKLEDIAGINVGTILEFNKPSEDYLDLLINNKVIARGETVKVGEKFGIQIKEIKSIQETIKSLGSS